MASSWDRRAAGALALGHHLRVGDDQAMPSAFSGTEAVAHLQGAQQVIIRAFTEQLPLPNDRPLHFPFSAVELRILSSSFGFHFLPAGPRQRGAQRALNGRTGQVRPVIGHP